MRTCRRSALSGRKIKRPQDLKKILTRLKTEGKVIVFTNGCFDLLHYGHVKYLEDAKKKGNLLVVAINSDTSVRRIKGKKRPLVNEIDRVKIIAALESVDFVVLFKEDTPDKIIRLLKPDVLIKGADWKKDDIVGADFVAGYGGVVCRIKLVKNYSTTELIKKIAKIF